jgi:threonine dehydrogenase-like Zn-dependent dehydrogenase
MGIVEEVGGAVNGLAPGDRVVVPFQIACGHCWMCSQGLQTQCESTQVQQFGMGAALFGYTKLYGQVPGAQAQYLRVPEAHYGPIKVPDGPPDDRYLFLSDVLPTAFQAVEYADVHEGETLLVLGLGPIGDMSARIASHRGCRVIGADVVPERRTRTADRGVEIIDPTDQEVGEVLRSMTAGRGADAVIDAVGMEAHGSLAPKLAQSAVGLLPKKIAQQAMQRVGVDRLAALYTAIDAVRRGGTISLSGVYGGQTNPLPMLTLFDKQITLRMGQANVRRWVDDIMPLLTDDDPLGVDTFATHHVPLVEAGAAYEKFQKKIDGAVKIVFEP